MRGWNCLKHTLAFLALPGMLILPSAASAAETQSKRRGVSVPNVALQTNSTLIGQVLDTNGRPVKKTDVTLSQNERNWSVQTNDKGQFQIAGIRGGLYQLSTQGKSTPVRLWAPDTAPPAARPGVLLVPEELIQRGQRPLAEVITNPLVIGGIILAAIAIPIAVHNSGSDSSTGS